MLKLYKTIDGDLHYWETWEKSPKTAIIHWGLVGERGESKEISSSLFSNCAKKVQADVSLRMKEGFAEIDPEDLRRLIVEYPIEGMGTEKDLEKRFALEDKLNEILGWSGLGNCDGGSIGSGTMEVCCFVVSFDIAKKVIETKLKSTSFDDYTRIYDEDSP